jgi:hypothetical protein
LPISLLTATVEVFRILLFRKETEESSLVWSWMAEQASRVQELADEAPPTKCGAGGRGCTWRGSGG